MRYPPRHKEETRHKIVDAAAKAFRRHGVDGASVSEIMADAGLTVGGFYRHFESKEALFQEAMERALGETIALMQARRERHTDDDDADVHQGPAWKARAAGVYLSPEHREMEDRGCPLPGLTAEIGRRGPDARRSFEESLKILVDEVAGRLDPEQPEDAELEALGFVSTLVGSLLLARGVDDEELSDKILRAGRQASR